MYSNEENVRSPHLITSSEVNWNGEQLDPDDPRFIDKIELEQLET